MKNPAQARKWVVISALVVAGVWGYRRLREGPEALTAFPEFVTGWGAAYFILAMTAEAAPRFAGSFSVLVMVADILTNAKPGDKQHGLLADLNAQLAKAPSSKAQPQAKATAPAPSFAAAAGPGFRPLSTTFPK